MEDMNVVQYHLEDWGDESDPNSDWNLFQKHATFSHREFCEFILYVGGGEGGSEGDYHIKHYEELGFSKRVVGLCRNAKKRGHKYICFWAG